MKTKLFLMIQTLLLLGTAVFILVQILNQEIHWYIHQRFIALTILAVILLTLMGIVSIKQLISSQPHTPGYLELSLLSIPLLIGLLIPAKPLSSSAVDTRNVILSAPGSLTGNSTSIYIQMDTQPLTILDWLNVFNQTQGASEYVGEQTQVSGFVLHDESLPENQFLLARFVITCCAADAFPVALVVEVSEERPAEDSWVIVTGVMEQITHNNVNLPLIKADTIQLIEQPDQPYLFP